MIQILALLLLSHKSLQLIFCVCLVSLCSLDWILSVVCLQVHFSFLCHHLSVVDCIQWICCLCYCIYGSEISILLFLIFLFLCWNFLLGSLSVFIIVHQSVSWCSEVLPQLAALCWCRLIFFSHSGWDFLDSWNDEWFSFYYGVIPDFE